MVKVEVSVGSLKINDIPKTTSDHLIPFLKLDSQTVQNIEFKIIQDKSLSDYFFLIGFDFNHLTTNKNIIPTSRIRG